MTYARAIVGVVVTHIFLLGCYNPEVRDCTVQCGAATDCTGGQICNMGWCAMPNKNCDSGGDDNDLAPDASSLTADASAACEMGCTNGTCIDGVCVIDCGVAWACQNDVLCPANLPCRVMCGYRSCGNKVICGLASSCEVRCIGDYACEDEVQCNSNRCDVQCIGSYSCQHRSRCANACACTVSCSGYGSCLEAAECPESYCRVGNGCTDTVAGCNTCN